jgi:kynurenine formamidase
MLRRIVDLSLAIRPSSPGHFKIPPHYADIEEIGKERSRTEVMSVCSLTPFAMDNDPEDIFMDIMLGHTIPHTHVESSLQSTAHFFGTLNNNEEWTRLDISQYPLARTVGMASVVDCSHVSEGGEITKEDLQKRGKHIQRGDIVLLYTGACDKGPSIRGGDHYFEKTAGITQEAAEWLVREKDVFVLGTDGGSVDSLDNIRKTGFLSIHDYLFRNGVLMLEVLDKIGSLSKERLFLDCGVVLKTSHIEDSPARVIALEDREDLSQSPITELFLPISPTIGDTPKPGDTFKRTEPHELEAEITKRCRIYGFQLSLDTWGIHKFTGPEMHPRGMLDWPHYLLISNRIGTYIEVPFVDTKGHGVPGKFLKDVLTLRSIDLCGRGVVVDLTNTGPRQVITARELKKRIGELKEGDIALIKTGFTDNYYHREDFLDYSPGFSEDALDLLVQKRPKMVITDTACIEVPNARKIAGRPGHYLLFKNNIPMVKCAVNLWKLRKKTCFVSVSPIPLRGLNASPVRVCAIETYT